MWDFSKWIMTIIDNLQGNYLCCGCMLSHSLAMQFIYSHYKFHLSKIICYAFICRGFNRKTRKLYWNSFKNYGMIIKLSFTKFLAFPFHIFRQYNAIYSNHYRKNLQWPTFPSGKSTVDRTNTWGKQTSIWHHKKSQFFSARHT